MNVKGGAEMDTPTAVAFTVMVEVPTGVPALPVEVLPEFPPQEPSHRVENASSVNSPNIRIHPRGERLRGRNVTTIPNSPGSRAA